MLEKIHQLTNYVNKKLHSFPHLSQPTYDYVWFNKLPIKFSGIVRVLVNFLVMLTNVTVITLIGIVIFLSLSRVLAW